MWGVLCEQSVGVSRSFSFFFGILVVDDGWDRLRTFELE